MKKQLQIIGLAILFAPLLSINAQNTWAHYDVSDGLIQNDILDVLIEDNQTVWLSSEKGLAEFNPTTKSFGTTYTTLNSNLNNDTILQLAKTNGKLWLRTKAGVSSLDAGIITNYTTSNGLLNNDVKDFTVDANDQLWIISPTNVSYFNGTTFIHDTTIGGYQIAADDFNHVFVLEHRLALFNGSSGQAYTHHVYDGTSWTQPPLTGIDSSTVVLIHENLEKKNGKVFLKIRDFYEGVYELSYPFQLDSIVADWRGQPDRNGSSTQRVSEIDFASGNKMWAINAQYGLLTGVDSLLLFNLNPLYNGDFYTSSQLFTPGVTVKNDLVIATALNGIYVGNSATNAINNSETIAVNSIRTSINTRGPLFYDYLNTLADFEMVKDSNQYSIYAANFWITSKKAGDSIFKVNFEYPFFPSYIEGPVSSTAGIEQDWIIKLTRQEINTHRTSFNQAGYVVPDNIKNWFAYGDSTLGLKPDLAPFVDVDNDNCYNPLAGDYPAIKGDEAIYWINHIGDQEYHGMLYGFDSPNTALNQTLFLEYSIINRGSTPYDSMKVGLYADTDLGNPFDDYVGCDSTQNIFYTYNGDNYDDDIRGRSGYGSFTPSVGFKFLSDSMEGFVYYNSNAGPNGSPTNAEEINHYLNSRWKNGQAMTYGGNGFSTGSSTPAKYMFTGNPLTSAGWTEKTPYPGLNRNAEGDRRSLAHIPNFSLQPNERKTISVAIGYGRNTTPVSIIGENVQPMIDVLNEAKITWDTTNYASNTLANNDSCNVVTSIQKNTLVKTDELFKIYPNPTEGNFTIKLNETHNSRDQIEIYSMTGQLLKTIENPLQIQKIEVDGLSNGIYFIKMGNSSQKLILSR